MGFHQGLASESYDRKYSNKRLLSRIWRYTEPHKFKLLLILTIVLISGVSGAFPAWLVSRVLDQGSSAHPETTTTLLLVVAVIFIEVLGFVLYYINQRLSVRVIAAINSDLSTDAFAACMRQDMAFYDELSSGKIVSRITSDTRDFGTMVSLTASVLSDFIQSFAIAIILIRTEYHLAGILFLIVPVLVIVILTYRKLARRVTIEGMRAMANVNATIKETISGISVAKNFRQEMTILDDFQRSNVESYQVNIKRGLVLSIVFPTTRLLTGLMAAILVYFGARSVIAGVITAGAWYLFVLSADRFMLPILSITSFWAQVQAGFSAAERIFALIDAKRSVTQTGDFKPETLVGKIDFDHVTFRYRNGNEVLKDFSLNIAPGENVAIVGHTGAGKSSITRLITRFYEFQEGRVLIDDRDIRDYHMQTLREHMGIVTQVPFLFDGTVEENIRFSQPNITRTEIVEIASQIGGGEWLATFSHGLDTRVGERGAHISMGQRQLVALMRVLVHKPSIFILDEATASIDPFTEMQIQAALNLILKHSTSVMIAHRLSTVRGADRIIVLENGHIIEEGTHSELLTSGGHYADLYNTYFRHQSLDYVEQAGRKTSD
ncbi:MAG: ABC transporter ATP-binding protein [Chloroflexi bacterium]|nr:ABC transporter ATP-binding protein [Chloroflexota bacterium]